jgi:hypothetical protein
MFIFLNDIKFMFSKKLYQILEDMIMAGDRWIPDFAAMLAQYSVEINMQYRRTSISGTKKGTDNLPA